MKGKNVAASCYYWCYEVAKNGVESYYLTKLTLIAVCQLCNVTNMK